jgi:hypothetical protein
MNYTGKKYTDLVTGRVIEIKDHFEDIAILDNGSKVKVSRLLDKNYFDEFIDPKSFFQNESLLNTFAQKIKQIPDSVINNINESVDNFTQNDTVDLNNISGSTSIRPAINESAVIMSDPEIEKEELMRKYGIPQSNAVNAAQQQMEMFQNLLNDKPVTQVNVSRDEEPVQRIEVNRDEQELIQNSRVVSQPKVEDPIITMFKNCKRNKDFKITLDIENKIPRPDFIEMMEDSYNTSIIEFLADEFTNNLLSNPNIIKDKIKNEISKLVYGEEKIEEVSSKPSTDVNSQITDSVTQINKENKSVEETVETKKKNTTRKTKKESIEK